MRPRQYDPHNRPTPHHLEIVLIFVLVSVIVSGCIDSQPAGKKDAYVNIDYSDKAVDAIGSFSASSNKTFLIITMDIENRGYERFSVNPLYFNVISNAISYGCVLASSKLSDCIEACDVLNDGRTNGSLAFEVPSDIQSYTLQYSGFQEYKINYKRYSQSIDKKEVCVNISYSDTMVGSIESFSANPNKTFLVITMHIENIGYYRFSVNPLYFNVISDNKSYSYAIASSCLSDCLMAQDVLDGGKTNGSLAFELPSEIQNYTLRYSGFQEYKINYKHNIVTNKLPIASVRVNGVDINESDVLYFLKNETISLDASNSTDPDGQITSVSWDMGDGGSPKTGKTITHSYTTLGNYSVIVKLTDYRSGETRFSFTIVITNKLPIAKISVNGENINKGDTLTVSTCEVIYLDASKSSDPDGQIVKVSWDMGDGNPAKTGKCISYSYTVDGTYSVVAKITDDESGEAQFPFTIFVGNKLPIARISVNGQSVNKNDTIKYSVGKELTFDALYSTDPDGQVATVSWNMGDGTQKTGRTVKYTFSTGGSYDIQVKLTDDRGGVTTFAFTIDISNVPPAI